MIRFFGSVPPPPRALSLGAVLTIALLPVMVLPARAGKNANGALIVHTNDSVSYTSTGLYCGADFDDPIACAQANTRTDKDENTPAVIWFLAAFPDTSDPAVTVAYFGIDHNLPPGQGYFADWDLCGPAGSVEVPDTGWPESVAAGNSVGFGSPIAGDNLFPFYWLAAYGFTGAYLGTAINPTGGYAGFVDDSNPGVIDQITRFGTVRWNAAGLNECPGSGGDGPDGPEEPDEPDGPGGGGDLVDTPYVPPENPSPIVSAYIYPEAIRFGDRDSGPVPIESVSFNDPALRDTLISAGARTIAPEYPHASLADTTGYDTNGRTVKLPDISSFYLLEFADPEAAILAIPSLRRASGIRIAEVLTATVAQVTYPNDPYFDAWRYLTDDAQWFLENDGERESDWWNPRCSRATAGADVKAQGAWLRGLGDPATVIGIVDTGILGGMMEGGDSHEDLLVVPLSYADRALISNHPDLDWCMTHGTRMGGISAARTNNAVGVAGVCGNCSLLDIESACCLDPFCADHSESWCNCVSHWAQNIDGALGLSLPDGKVLRVLNLSFGSSGWMSTGWMLTLWRAFSSNRILVASSGDVHSEQPQTGYPANAPFVLGAGGSTWHGLFWDYGTSCYATENGTTIGYSEWSEFGGPGGRICDVCAPASGNYLVPEPVEHTTDSGYYWTTSGQTSGAAAQVSGAAGLIQSLARESFGEDLPADDVMGILEATATPWPADNHPSTYSVCPTCPPEYFGNGILNVEAAAEMITDYDSYWRPGGDPDACERVARKVGGDIIPGTWQFTIVDSAVVSGTKWIEYKAQADVRIPAPAGPPLRNLPERVGWVRRLSANTNTFASYSNLMATRIDMMQEEIRDCHLSVIDQETGVATISGYTFASRDPVTGELTFVVAEDNIRMAYVILCNYPVSVEEQSISAAPLIRLTGMACPVRLPLRLSAVTREAGAVRVEVYDVAGRRLRGFDLGRLEAGRHPFTWDGIDMRGERAPAGVYWVQARLAGVAQTKRLVLLD